MSSLANHSLKLLCELYRLVILRLSNPAAIQKLLHLLPRITLERLLKLLESLEKSIHWGLPLHHLIKRVHSVSTSMLFSFSLSASISLEIARRSAFVANEDLSNPSDRGPFCGKFGMFLMV